MLGGPTTDDASTGVAETGPSQEPRSITFVSGGEEDTGLLAQLLVKESRPGDVICLYGQVGAGKSVFSRAFIRAVAGDPNLVVPSPTFLLQQVYEDHPGTPVHHFDLYRLTGPTENFERLGMEESFGTAISLIEWPECLGADLPKERLDIHIDMASPEPKEHVGSLSDVAQAHTPHPVVNSPSEPLAADPSRQGNGHTDDDLEEDELDEDTVEDDAYSDKRPRRFVLKPQGESWVRRLQKFAGRKQSCSEDKGHKE